MIVSAKWILPQVSFMRRPNIFGYQKVMPAKIANRLPPKST